MNTYFKELIRTILRYSPIYFFEKHRELSEFKYTTLEKAIRSAIKDVPYYSNYKHYICNGFDLKSFPLLRKSDIMGREKEFVSKKAIKKLTSIKETGGSTGKSLELFESFSTQIKKNIIPDYAFSLIGKNLRIAVLRGNKPSKGKICEQINQRYLLLSSYQLSENTVDEYLKGLKESKSECLHVYPSSISILARLIKKKYGTADLPHLKGIFSSSEIFAKEEKQLVMEVFPNVKLIDYYGHNELACCAISEDNGFYKFNRNFGYVEFIDTGRIINGNHKIAEIIATSIMNKTMPFIRYATEDYVELDENGNVVSIIGRTSDFVVNQENQLVPCIVCTRNCSMQNVTSFQYYQDKIGEVIFKIKGNKEFGELDIQNLLTDMSNSFANMTCKVEQVNELFKTKIGKQPRLVQKLDLNKFK